MRSLVMTEELCTGKLNDLKRSAHSVTGNTSSDLEVVYRLRIHWHNLLFADISSHICVYW